MSKIFSVNFNKNSVLDEFGATATLGSTAKLVKDEKGMALNCTTQITDYINYGDIAAINNIGTGQFSFVVSTNIRRFLNHGSVYNSLFGKTDNFGTSGFGMMYPDSNSIFVRILNTTINVPSFDITGNHIFVFTRNSAGLCSIFIDGVLKGTPATQAGSISSTAVLAIGHEGVATTSNRTPDAIIYGASVYNHCLSQQEIDKLYADFVASKPISKPKRGFITMKPTDLSTQVNNTLGTDLISNGGFTSDSIWIKGTGWTINGNAAHYSSGTLYAGIYQNIGTAVGDKVVVTYTITAHNGVGSFFAQLGQADGVARTTTGTFTEIITAGSTNPQFMNFYNTSTSSVISFTNVKVYKFSGLIAAYNMKPVNGILTDISGNGNNGTVSGGVVSTKDGMLFNGGVQNIAITGATGLSDNLSLSCKFFIKSSGGGTLGRIFDNGKFVIVHQSNKIVVNRDNATSASSAASSLTYGTVNTLTVTSTSAGVTNIYINGVLSGTADQSAGTPVSATAWNIGNVAGLTKGWDGEIYDVRIYNRILSLQEIKDYSNSFVKPVIAEDFSDQPADGSNRVPDGWQQVSGTTKIGEINIAKGELIPAASSTFDTDGTSFYIIYNGTKTWEESSYMKGVVTGGSLCTIQRAGLFTIGKKYNVKFKARGTITSPGWFTEGYDTAHIIKKIFPTLSTSWQNYEVEFTSIIDGRLVIYLGSTGGYYLDIDNFSVQEIDPSLTVKQGTKYLEDVTVGSVHISSEVAYGTFEADFYKPDTSIILWYPIKGSVSDFLQTDGYYLQLGSAEALQLGRANGAVLFVTANSYISPNTWYKIRVTRTTAGVFTVLIKGGAFSPTAGYDGWTLVSVTGGSGSNPATDTGVTTSNAMVLRTTTAAGNRFTNLLITNGVKQ